MVKKIIKFLLPSIIKKWLKDLLAVYHYYFFLITKKIPLPKTVIIDPINICHLKCPLCPSGIGTMNYDPKVMSIETFEIIVDKVPFIKRIILYNWGEPFLNPDIFKMIKFASNRNIDVIISTHFSFSKNYDFFINIVESGLCRLIVSLDGVSQESYSKYRMGGDYDLVISNIKKLIDTKNKLKSKNPNIEWQFIVNKFNEHEIDTAKNCRRP